ncbi:cysteine dioxygenase [Luteibacter sahnii]|uniref:cysteine dioxygenase n=1 Tax=Luteibacter sahnii TaxID=3021977 RepID=UPI002A6B5F9D|nr:cysteine dioxygenase family protein [Luteibacter sp. PPL193]MDY1546742.1 cysteine dioxygenase family protein [Luteibacter sp. PPL193]
MGKRSSIIPSLCDVVFDMARPEHPDLASMGRDIGRMLHARHDEVIASLGALRERRRGFERWMLAERAKPAVSILVMTWPPGYATPVHDHAGLWGLEATIAGALEVESFDKGDAEHTLRSGGRTWLGPGDATWFDAGEVHAHRCRNLSRHDTALTLHVYGGDLAQYLAYEQPGPSEHWIARPRQSIIAGRLTA